MCGGRLCGVWQIDEFLAMFVFEATVSSERRWGEGRGGTGDRAGGAHVTTAPRCSCAEEDLHL